MNASVIVRIIRFLVGIQTASLWTNMITAVAAEICTSPTNTFTVVVDLYASELGYFTFEECGDTINPTIGMEVGETYTFLQSDRSNFYHPLGFAYYPDGAHDGVDELEPGVTPPGTSSNCAEGMTCPAPMYFLNDKYLGVYSNIDSVTMPTTGVDDFGLDAYEPLFFHPIPDWTSYGDFSIKLKFDDEDYDKDIFYFCHVRVYTVG